ncbi:MAG: ATP-binding protein [Phormidesmis sp.]
MTIGLAAEPSAEPEQALVQLLEHIRSVLISLLSYRLQPSLSTIQVAVEMLSEGDTMPAQAQRQALELSLDELYRLHSAVEGFLDYFTQIWSMTLDFIQIRSDTEVSVYLHSLFESLPEGLEGYQPWIATIKTRLTPFLQKMAKQDDGAVGLARSQQIALLEQERRQVLAIVNHELRTPFSTLQVCLETLQEEEDLSEKNRQTLLEVACTDLDRLSALVRDLDLLCRLKAGQICFQTELMDPSDTLQVALSSFLKQAPEAALSKLRVEWAAQLSPVWAYGDRLVEVIRRLLENAFRFTAAAGEIKIDVQMMDLDKVGSWFQPSPEMSMLRVCISDTGRGISRDQLTRVFDSFHQEEAYLQRTRGGMGIGLSICRSLVEGMGGNIWAESPGKQQGSQFCFTLPVRAGK